MPTITLPHGDVHYRTAGPADAAAPRRWSSSTASSSTARCGRRRPTRLAAQGVRSFAPDLPLGVAPHPGRRRTPTSRRAASPGRSSPSSRRSTWTTSRSSATTPAARSASTCSTPTPSRIGRLVLTNCDAFEQFPPPSLRPLHRARSRAARRRSPRRPRRCARPASATARFGYGPFARSFDADDDGGVGRAAAHRRAHPRRRRAGSPGPSTPATSSPSARASHRVRRTGAPRVGHRRPVLHARPRPPARRRLPGRHARRGRRAPARSSRSTRPIGSPPRSSRSTARTASAAASRRAGAVMRRVHLGAAVAVEVEHRALVAGAPVEVAAGRRPARRRRSAPGRRSGRTGRRSCSGPASRRPPRRRPWPRRRPTCRSGRRRPASRGRCGSPAARPGSGRGRSGSACCSRTGSARRPAAPSPGTTPASGGRCRSSSRRGRRTPATRRSPSGPGSKK